MDFIPGKTVKTFEKGGKKIILRYPKMDDVKGCMDYINSLVEEGARLLMVEKTTLKEEKEWLEGEIKSIKSGKKLTLFIEIGGKVAGVLSLMRRTKPPSAADHVAEIGFGIRKEFRRLGIMEEAVKTIFDLGKKWGIEIVRSSYMSDNIPSVKLHEKLGFREIGRIPKGAKYGKKYLDEILVIKELK